MTSVFSSCQGQNDSQQLSGLYLGQTPPGMTPELFAPGIISTNEFNARDLAISPDGKTIFFARTETGKSDDYNYDIMYTRYRNDKWTKPEKTSFSSPFGELEPFFSPDGETVFFNSNRPITVDGESEHWETWYVKKVGESWTEPELLGAPFQRVSHTTFSKTGKMYYTREDQFRLYRVNYKGGQFGEPEMLPETINAVEIQYNSFIAPDESYLVFTRHSEDGFGKGDLYVTFRNSDDEWTSPVNLGEEINSHELDSSPSLSPDGKYFFFTSKKGVNSDVYWVDANYIFRKTHPGKN